MQFFKISFAFYIKLDKHIETIYIYYLYFIEDITYVRTQNKVMMKPLSFNSVRETCQETDN